MKETLSIGEISALFHLNVQTLIYYDSIGLLVPTERNPSNGYRRYRFDQIYKLATIRYLSRLGYSLKEIGDSYLESRDIETTLEQFEKQSIILRKKAENLLNTDRAIQQKINFIKQELPKVDVESVSIKEFPERHYFPIGGEELLYGDDWFYLNPTVVFYKNDSKYFGAYLFDDGENTILQQEMTDSLQFPFIPAGRFLCGYHQGAYEHIYDSELRIRAAGGDLDLVDMTINFNIIDQFVERDSSRYITEVQIPIVQNEEDRWKFLSF
ncbi:putative transcriptional regulator [Desulfosporosinus orientis DSM 765]|uniref:Putative transcriptional regulator n=1 Tax=Desulfosporosinus orientis (strain ATCC 19365 / DSM 765 / NCIMB 8382 / VKM B-1628 / Singapore I) TaxID=768706 RepID=G7WH78_DESOD|nr:MerR family transcriptional regulator [Desulfosporosinus orientis]AET69586.1 putative transcriptional regulator [Desulfosporosinus orientis DSM 765]